MKTTLIIFFNFFIFIGVNAQCYTVAQTTYSLDSLTSPTYVTLMDDQYSGLIPIGFSFCF